MTMAVSATLECQSLQTPWTDMGKVHMQQVVNMHAANADISALRSCSDVDALPLLTPQLVRKED